MITPEMVYSGTGLAMTERDEGCVLTAYQDPGGVWTNGYGNTHGVVPGSTITMDQAIADLKANTQNAVNAVNRLVNVQLTQGEFDALVDFVYNCGETAFAKSTMLMLINKNNFVLAANQFELWDHVSGKVVAGLLKRRLDEKAEFQS